MGIQTVARQLIGKGDIYMGRKAKKFTKIATNLNVRFGSRADITSRPRHVRSSPQSRHSSARFVRPISATSGRRAPRMLFLLSRVYSFLAGEMEAVVKGSLRRASRQSQERSPAHPPAAALQSTNHAEEFLPRQRIVTEAAQHSAGDEVCVRLMHASGGHAVMRRL